MRGVQEAKLHSTPPQTWAGQSINGQTGKPLALHLGGSHREGAQRGVAIDLGTCRSSAQTSLHLLQILRTRRPGSVSASALEALEWLLSGLAAELMRGLVTLVCYQGSVSSAAQGSRLLLPFCPPPLALQNLPARVGILGLRSPQRLPGHPPPKKRCSTIMPMRMGEGKPKVQRALRFWRKGLKICIFPTYGFPLSDAPQGWPVPLPIGQRALEESSTNHMCIPLPPGEQRHEMTKRIILSLPRKPGRLGLAAQGWGHLTLMPTTSL